MIFSTSGNEIDIPAFIIYLFENNPNPMIYLEKKEVMLNIMNLKYLFFLEVVSKVYHYK